MTAPHVRGPIAADVIPRPPDNPPLGELPGDHLLTRTQAARVAGADEDQAAEDATRHDAAMERLVAAVHGAGPGRSTA